MLTANPALLGPPKTPMYKNQDTTHNRVKCLWRDGLGHGLVTKIRCKIHPPESRDRVCRRTYLGSSLQTVGDQIIMVEGHSLAKWLNAGTCWDNVRYQTFHFLLVMFDSRKHSQVSWYDYYQITRLSSKNTIMDLICGWKEISSECHNLVSIASLVEFTFFGHTPLTPSL